MAKTVWLTLDDGPHPNNTPTVLSTLQDKSVKGVFFLIGKEKDDHPKTALAIANAGHAIANHTYTHANLDVLANNHKFDEIKNEIMKAHDTLKDLANYKKWVRPPFNAYTNPKVREIIEDLGFKLASYNVDTEDYGNKPHTDWIPKGIAGIERPGSIKIVLNHDIHKNTADHYKEFIEKIEDIDGTQFGKPEDMVPIS